MTVLEIDGHRIEIGNEDKVFFAEPGITKGDVVEYHRRIAERMLPFVQHRLLVMRRFPDGIDADGFYQKNASDHFPDWIDTATVDKREGGTVQHVVANDAATLVYLADQGMIEAHTLLAPAAHPGRPDQLILDLDPSTEDIDDVVAATRILRRLLEDLGVTGFVKSTGSRGVHVLVGLDGEERWAEVRDVAHRLAEAAVERDPDLLTVAHSKASRGERVFVDWLRNGYGQHAVVPYGLRALPAAPVAVPLDWDEATSASFDPQGFTLRNVFRRLGQKDDPWADIGSHRYSASSLGDRLERLSG